MKFSDLIDSSESIQPGVYNRAVIDEYEITELKVVPMLGMKTKIVSAFFRSNRDVYKTVVQVNGVEEGVLPSEENHMTVRCSCPSFRFWFGNANRQHHILFGIHMKKYIPVPDHLSQRPKQPPKNPGHIPGVCKHIIGLVKVMRRVGEID